MEISANQVIENLLDQIKLLSKENAMLKTQLQTITSKKQEEKTEA